MVISKLHYYPESEQVAASTPAVSVIVPARNEEVCLGDCLASLVAQTGVVWEIIVVDDHSTDRTGEIAASFSGSGVRVIEAGPLPAGWTGKNNAVASGARASNAEWLLFTDADTVHLPGSMARSLAEAKQQNVSLLSYSPEQITVTFWEIATLPVIFAELARQYPPSQVSDGSSPAAANGQYILIRRDAYEAVGGHAALRGEILEDVALAQAVKNSGRKIRFRYAADAVRTRMYRNFRQLREGWTKNLVLLFPNPTRLAMKMLFLWTLAWGTLLLPRIISAAAPTGYFQSSHGMQLALRWSSFVGVVAVVALAIRLRRSNFAWDRVILGAIFGMPMFAYLLFRSKRAHTHGSVLWKGRAYSDKGDLLAAGQ